MKVVEFNEFMICLMGVLFLVAVMSIYFVSYGDILLCLFSKQNKVKSSTS